MSVYVGIDVHRKRSQVAVVTEDGTVQLNKNTVNGTAPILRLIGDLPSGTPVAFEAAFGWSWLAELLEDYGFEAHLVHPAAVQGDRLRAAEERQGPARRPWRSCCGRTYSRRRGSRLRRCASSARCVNMPGVYAVMRPVNAEAATVRGDASHSLPGPERPL